MNKAQLKHRLGIDRIEMASVSDDLHRWVMGAVSNASIGPVQARSFGFFPLVAAGAAATLAAVLIWNNWGQDSLEQPLPNEVAVDEPAVAADSINQRMAVLGGQVRLPEAALRQELERLESDLKRFRLSS